MFIIETYFNLSDTWENTYTETTNGRPRLLSFSTEQEAKDRLQELIDDGQEAYNLGYIDTPYTNDDFRIREVKHSHADEL